MIYISRVTNDTTVNFAAEELKKYIRMMDPKLDVSITDDDRGYKLGLMSDFGLDTSDCLNTDIDDVIYIDTYEDSGIISGSNPRSVLLAVYELLRKNGCRWLFPGIDGEYIPEGHLKRTNIRHKPSMRFRGACLEGSVSQESLINLIDYLPKVGMNMFESQFFLPIFFYQRHYCHWSSDVRDNEHINGRTVERFMAMAECEIKKRGIEYHAIGHGWTTAPFGIDSSTAWTPVDESSVSSDVKPYLAMVRGERKLYKSVPTNTQFCMSNTNARKIVADYVVDYAEKHSYVDFIHLYLADGKNNHCECNECVKKSPSDWLVVLLNEIDKALAKKGLTTHIVFPTYTETTWAPDTEVIQNPDRFVMMFAPITRSYTRTLGDKPEKRDYVRNNITLPKNLTSYLEYSKDWRKSFSGSSVCFEYYFWLHQYFDVSTVSLAKRIFEDLECYYKHGFQGVISCGSQRSAFPNGFSYYLFALKQYDMSLTYEEVRKDYFSHAYGRFADEVYKYFDSLNKVFKQGFMEGEESIDYSISEYYNPEIADQLKSVTFVTKKIRDILDKNEEYYDRTLVVSFTMLRFHTYLLDKLSHCLALKADGKDDLATEAFETMRREVSKREIYFEHQFDFGYFIEAIRRIIKGKQREDAFSG